LKIQDGCDYNCTFCTIPQARGESRSLSIDKIASQFQNLIFQNFKEIVLTGVNIGDYGSKIDTNLYKLIKKLLTVDGDYRIRLSSIEPNLLTNEIVELVQSEDKLCKHLHIPLQSGSNSLLKQMRRRYLSELYLKRIEKVKSSISNCGIGVDVIVGFPNESDEDFERTYNFLKELPISYLHVFTYSNRPGTYAAEMKNQIPKNVRKERTNRLRILSAKKKHAFYSEMIGKKERILFEHREPDGYFKGFSSNYVRAAHKPEIDLTNTFTDFLINRIQNEYCLGKTLNIY
jgi:threonylcarbamoyladenosine tRNA methylthiotransferase MtaB